MNYSTGEVVNIGDSVALEYGKTPGFVQAVIESPQQIEEWGLDEPGSRTIWMGFLASIRNLRPCSLHCAEMHITTRLLGPAKAGPSNRYPPRAYPTFTACSV